MLRYPVVPIGRRSLGAEELIELGQASQQISTSTQLVTLTPSEGKLIVQVVENLVSFAQDFPIEFQSYCPPDRWQKAMEEVGTWSHQIENQLNSGAKEVQVPAEMVFRLVDLEKCVSAARDARLSSSRWAFTLTAAGGIADFLLGITWLGVPMYLLGLGILFGRPLYAKFQATPEEPFVPAIAGRRACMSGECELIAMKLKEEEEANPDRRKVLERVIVSPYPKVQRYHWGEVRPNPSARQGAVFLKKDRFRVRVEGWVGDVVTPTEEWSRTTEADCDGQIQIAVMQAHAPVRQTPWGPLNADSGHEGTYWVEYVGPMSDGAVRRAGPFGCTGDPVDHAMEDSGFEEPGVDGGYVIFDKDGEVVKEETLQ